jgi:ABC-2 type transport system ATP-binding protein
VDPVGRRDIRQIIAHLKSEGRTVFLNSHLLSEV